MPDPSFSRRELLRVAGLTAAGLAIGGPLAACARSAPAQNQSFSVDQIAYGTEVMQMGELSKPLLGTPRPVVVLIHGGYWRLGFNRSAMDDLAKDLAHVGYATWNIDYRRVGEPGGGWPGTFQDVAAAIDKLAEFAPDKKLDLDRVAFLGHSAGAELALWAAARTKLPSGSVGTNPRVTPAAVVSLSGVLDMQKSATSATAGGEQELRTAVTDVLGGSPGQVPDRYAIASPLDLLPLGVPQLLMHGTADDRVPIAQSRAYVKAATDAGDKVTLVELDGVDHFAVVRSTRTWWDQVVAWLAQTMGAP